MRWARIFNFLANLCEDPSWPLSIQNSVGHMTEHARCNTLPDPDLFTWPIYRPMTRLLGQVNDGWKRRNRLRSYQFLDRPQTEKSVWILSHQKILSNFSTFQTILSHLNVITCRINPTSDEGRDKALLYWYRTRQLLCGTARQTDRRTFPLIHLRRLLRSAADKNYFSFIIWILFVRNCLICIHTNLDI